MKEPLTKHKWELDLNCTYYDTDWHKLFEQAQMHLIFTKHRLMQFNIAHHILYTCSAPQIQQQYPTYVPEM